MSFGLFIGAVIIIVAVIYTLFLVETLLGATVKPPGPPKGYVRVNYYDGTTEDFKIESWLKYDRQLRKRTEELKKATPFIAETIIRKPSRFDKYTNGMGPFSPEELGRK